MTAGYSGKALSAKLGIREGNCLWLINPPDNYEELLGIVPANLTFHTQDTAPQYDVIHLFTNKHSELEQRLYEAKERIHKKGMIWVSWYKKSAKLPTEISEDNIRRAALDIGLVDVKVCAVDEQWSALKLVWRVQDR